MAKKRYLKPRLPTLSRLIRDAFEDVSRGVEAQVRLAGVTVFEHRNTTERVLLSEEIYP
jgi:hypothetical protein